RASLLSTPLGSPLDADPGDDRADDVGGELLGITTARDRFPPGPRIDQIEERLGRKSRVHLAELARAHTFIEDLLDRREEVPEESASGLTGLIDGQLDAAVAHEPRTRATRAHEISER